MSDFEEPNGHVRQDEAHELWVAMQSAYAEYLRASEVFENSRELTRDSADSGRCGLTLLDCRRDAFERYLEARIGYLEGRYDEGYRREAALVSGPTSEARWLRTVFQRASPEWLIASILVVGIWSVTLFAFVREQNHLRDLISVRDHLGTSLNDTREELLSLAKRFDARESTERSVRQVSHTAQPPAPAPQVAGRKPSGGPRWRRLPERIVKTPGRSVAARGYFSLSRSPQFKRVGPINVSLKSVDMQRNSVDIFIVSEPGNVSVHRLKLNEPVRIWFGFRKQPVELVVDRITANGLSGHLIESQG